MSDFGLGWVFAFHHLFHPPFSPFAPGMQVLSEPIDVFSQPHSGPNSTFAEKNEIGRFCGGQMDAKIIFFVVFFENIL